ncbi:MAG: hypothetical protein FWE04_03015 [Oscillospiraceae bacterium]|nr:hypothetical protein [Oscillospiraceae bacterium]
MKKVIISIVIIIALVAVGLFLFTDIFGGNADGDIMGPNEHIIGEVAEIDGSTLLLRMVEMPGGMQMGGGRFVTGGGGGQAVTVIRDEDDDIHIHDEDYLYEPEDIADGEYVVRQRIAGADAETDRIRIADAPEGAVIRGEAPTLRRTGQVREITLPRNAMVTTGFADTEEQVALSTLEVGDVIVVLYDADGRLDSIRLMPLQVED